MGAKVLLRGSWAFTGGLQKKKPVEENFLTGSVDS
jgi:hypothetical protein